MPPAGVEHQLEGQERRLPAHAYLPHSRSASPHRHDVLRRDVGLDVVHGVEDEAAARRQRVDVAPHVVAHLLRRAVRQHVLGVDPAAPEDDVLAEIALELDRVHSRRPDVHRVQDVHADLDEVGQQRAHVAARVEEELRVRRQFVDAA